MNNRGLALSVYSLGVALIFGCGQPGAPHVQTSAGGGPDEASETGGAERIAGTGGAVDQPPDSGGNGGLSTHYPGVRVRPATTANATAARCEAPGDPNPPRVTYACGDETCVVGESYCYVSRLRDGSSGSFCKSAARRYTGCADVPEAGYVNCWCSDGDGQVTVSCDQI